MNPRKTIPLRATFFSSGFFDASGTRAGMVAGILKPPPSRRINPPIRVQVYGLSLATENTGLTRIFPTTMWHPMCHFVPKPVKLFGAIRYHTCQDKGFTKVGQKAPDVAPQSGPGDSRLAPALPSLVCFLKRLECARPAALRAWLNSFLLPVPSVPLTMNFEMHITLADRIGA